MRIALTLGLTLGFAQALWPRARSRTWCRLAGAGRRDAGCRAGSARQSHAAGADPAARAIGQAASPERRRCRTLPPDLGGRTERRNHPEPGSCWTRLPIQRLRVMREAVGLSVRQARDRLPTWSDWLAQHRDLAVADRVYRLAVAHSTKKVRKHHKTITVAVVTNIPAPVTVPSRTGGYEDQELPEPTPGGEAGRARSWAKFWRPSRPASLMPPPNFCRARSAPARAQKISPSSRIASPPPIWPKAWTHRPSSWRPALPTPEPCRSSTGMPASPPIAWAAGPTRPPIWRSWRRMAAFKARMRAQGRLLGGAGPYAGRRYRERVVSLACGRGQGGAQLSTA